MSISRETVGENPPRHSAVVSAQWNQYDKVYYWTTNFFLLLVLGVDRSTFNVVEYQWQEVIYLGCLLLVTIIEIIYILARVGCCRSHAEDKIDSTDHSDASLLHDFADDSEFQ